MPWPLLAIALPAWGQQPRLCEDVYADIQAGMADPFGALLAWQPGERIVLADVFRCQEAWFRQQNAHATVRQAAALHVLAGLKAFSDADDEQKPVPGAAAAHFCSGRVLAPDLAFPEQQLPPDLGTWWRTACGASPIERVARGPWVVDGTRVEREIPLRPDLQPYLFQRLDEGGEVDRSVLVAPGMAMPPLDVPDWFDAPVADRRPDVGALSLTGAGLASAAVGGLLVWQATVYAPERHSGTLTPEGFEAWRDEVLAPRRDAGYALIGAGSAALVGAAVSFAL
jgi:hypothetical protein